MSRNLLSLPKKTFRRFWGKSERDKHLESLYTRKGYLDAYSEHTDVRVERDPHAAVGGRWEEIGKLQFDFLVSNGLQLHHKLLDIGCGTLRGGRHFIKYLNAGNYSGIDISPKAIEYGKRLVAQEGQAEKHPRLLVSRNKDLKFKEFDGEVFDYLLAQSVFTHLKPEHIEECFQYSRRVMSQDSVFLFTFNEELKFKQTGLKAFCYPFSFFQALADQYGFNLADRSGEYGHPRGQQMAMLSKKERTHR
jgi:SAM-dependent methyltransferase